MPSYWNWSVIFIYRPNAAIWNFLQNYVFWNSSIHVKLYSVLWAFLKLLIFIKYYTMEWHLPRTLNNEPWISITSDCLLERKNTNRIWTLISIWCIIYCTGIRDCLETANLNESSILQYDSIPRTKSGQGHLLFHK